MADDTPDDTTLAEATASAVRAELARKHRSGVDAARVLRISQAAISRRLRGETSFTATELLTLAKWLDTPAAQLIGEPPAAPEQVPA